MSNLNAISKIQREPDGESNRSQEFEKTCISAARLFGRSEKRDKERKWFAVGIYYQKIGETAVYELPQIEPTDVVFARRRLKPDEIERLGLQRGQVVLCTSTRKPRL